MSTRKSLLARLLYYGRLVREYWQATSTFVDFAKLMQVRLAPSKIGWLVCPAAREVEVDFATLGRQVRLRTRTSDISVLGELLVSRGYQPLLQSLRGNVRNIVDLGANTGLTVRWFLFRYPDANVVAVEPEAGNARILRANVRGLGDRVRVYEACIGSRRRLVRMVSDAGAFAFHMKEVPEGQQDDGTVPVVTMDDILGETGLTSIDVLKCDIEGAESELFSACRSWIGLVRHAVVECHQPFTGQDLLTILADNGGRFVCTATESNPAYRSEVLFLRQAPT